MPEGRSISGVRGFLTISPLTLVMAGAPGLPSGPKFESEVGPGTGVNPPDFEPWLAHPANKNALKHNVIKPSKVPLVLKGVRVEAAVRIANVGPEKNAITFVLMYKQAR